MTVLEAANRFGVDRKTILAVCHDPELRHAWGCIMIAGEWHITNPPPGDHWYCTKRVAEIMGKSRVQIYRLCKIGALRSIMIGRTRRIAKAEAIKMLEIRY